MIEKLRERRESGLATPADAQGLTIRDALRDLSVGLFRRGCADNGSAASIVSKEILAGDSPGGSSSGGNGTPGGRGNDGGSNHPPRDYYFDVDARTDTVHGTVPFYSPRTPGNVVFRLYFEDDPSTTLATGPCVRVVPGDSDVEPVLRFVLGNFKARKTNGMSSMGSFAQTLELFSPAPPDRRPRSSSFDHQGGRNQYAGPGRAAWGCLCEARKVVESAAQNYVKKKEEIREKAEAERLKGELPDLDSLAVDGDGGAEGEVAGSEKKKGEEGAAGGTGALTDTTTTPGGILPALPPAAGPASKLASEEYSNERRWREAQNMYAAVLRAALTNDACASALFKRDMVARMRLEYCLWCPIVEAFAPNPFARGRGAGGNGGGGKGSSNGNLDASRLLPGDVSRYPHPVTKEHVRMCQASRAAMQREILGFVPAPDEVSSLVPAQRKGRGANQRGGGGGPNSGGGGGGTNLLDDLTSSMRKLHEEEYAVSESVVRRREDVRRAVEGVVTGSGYFPEGTRVAVFGSSANGFG